MQRGRPLTDVVRNLRLRHGDIIVRMSLIDTAERAWWGNNISGVRDSGSDYGYQRFAFDTLPRLDPAQYEDLGWLRSLSKRQWPSIVDAQEHEPVREFNRAGFDALNVTVAVPPPSSASSTVPSCSAP